MVGQPRGIHYLDPDDVWRPADIYRIGWGYKTDVMRENVGRFIELGTQSTGLTSLRVRGWLDHWRGGYPVWGLHLRLLSGMPEFLAEDSAYSVPAQGPRIVRYKPDGEPLDNRSMVTLPLAIGTPVDGFNARHVYWLPDGTKTTLPIVARGAERRVDYLWGPEVAARYERGNQRIDWTGYCYVSPSDPGLSPSDFVGRIEPTQAGASYRVNDGRTFDDFIVP